MTDIEFILIFEAPEGQTIDNGLSFRIRHDIAMMMEDAGFGEIIELPLGRFANVFAEPVRDTLDERNQFLHVSYRWHFPLRHGDLGHLVGIGLQKLVNDANTHYNGIFFIYRLSFIRFHEVRLPGANLN